jgi:hypothetical protein
MINVIMVKCKICGFEKEKSIKDHLKHTHKINKEKYLELYPNSEIYSDSFKKEISCKNKKMWADDDFKSKMSKIRKETHNKPEFKEKQRKNTLKIFKEQPEKYDKFINYHKTDEFKQWVCSKERCDKISETSKKRWLDIDYRNKVIKSINKILLDGRCAKSDIFKDKMSEIISKKYANGELTNKSNKYKTGYYISKNNESFWYQSSYEEKCMQFFDQFDPIKWTNKHGIIIPYNMDGKTKRYVPDFLIQINEHEYIIEMKGWWTEEVELKRLAAIEIYGDKYKIFYNIKTLKKFINEVQKN